MRSRVEAYQKVLALLCLFATCEYAAVSQSAIETNETNPIGFVENKGQVIDQYMHQREDVAYLGHHGALQFVIRQDGLSYQWQQQGDTALSDTAVFYRVDLDWMGQREAVHFRGEADKGMAFNYYNSRCPGGLINVRSYQRVVAEELYSSIDLVCHSEASGFKYDLLVHPGGDYRSIQMEIKGAKDIVRLKDGAIVIHTPMGNIVEGAPKAFQQGREVQADWKVEGNRLSFELGDFDPSKMLTIDPPVRLWGTYYGGAQYDVLDKVRVNSAHEVICAGFGNSVSNIATSGAHQTSAVNNWDGYLAKFDSTGNQMWGTYYASSGVDQFHGLRIDGADNIIVAGVADDDSTLVTSGVHQTNYGGGSQDGIVAKFNNNGVRIWATYIGGSSTEWIRNADVDGSNNIYVCGYTTSSNGIATSGAHQFAYASGSDAFLVKFSTNGQRIWGTYYGGSSNEDSWEVSVDQNADVILLGQSASTSGIATSGSHQTSLGGSVDAMVVKFDSSGAQLWGTYYGGSGLDRGIALETGADACIYIGGHTQSSNGIATSGAHQTSLADAQDAFLAKLDSSGVRQWGTYYGGSSSEWMYEIVEFEGDVILSAQTAATTGIATTDGYQASSGGSTDGCMVMFSPTGVRVWGTYYGGTGSDRINGIDCSASDRLYACGESTSDNAIASSGTHQTSRVGQTDGFLARFSICAAATIDSVVGGGSVCATDSVQLQVFGNLRSSDQWYWYTDSCGGTLIDSGQTVQVMPNNSVVYYVRGEGTSTACNVTGECDSTTVTVSLSDSSTLSDVFLCEGDSVLAFGIYRDSAGTYYDTLQNTAGCDSIIVQQVLVNASHEDTLPSIEICVGDSALIFGAYADTTGWYVDSAQTASGCDSVSVQQLLVFEQLQTQLTSFQICNGDSVLIFGVYRDTAGLYTDTLTSSAGCDSVVLQELALLPDILTILPTIEICAGDSAVLFDVYRTKSDVYSDTFPSSNGCDSIIQQTLLVHPVEYTDLGEAYACEGDSVFLFGTYRFASGTYSDSLTSVHGCDSIVLQTLTYYPVPRTTLIPDTICQGEEILMFDNYESEEGTYYDTLVSAVGCDSILIKDLVVLLVPELNVNMVPEFCPGTEDGSVSVNVTSGDAPFAFEWSSGDTTSSMQDIHSGDYTITVIGANGCSTEQLITITNDTAECVPGDLWVPNIFSPNGDGQNDIVYVEGLGITALSFIVFDRWGHIVFQTADQSQGWDGIVQGTHADPGVYVYFITATFNTGQTAELRGNITLVK